MANFHAVNTQLSPPDVSVLSRGSEETTPTTPRPNARFSDQPPREIPSASSNPRTPTRHDFGGIPGQRALPDSTASQPESTISRETSHRSSHSHRSSDSQDVDMADDDDDDEDEESDDGSMTSENGPPSKKKKKGQRFFCTDFPPCSLSFTRSEHLARHIRKHTGERPFQCHCNRRFSRLDNLRQHAQTVHVNEDIPNDSLAATGTRFQRQIRTDRVRPAGGRSRAGTLGSQGGHSRGHSRNLSTSSIASNASSMSSYDDGRRRPPPLAMAQEGSSRPRLTMETFTNPAIGSPGPGPQYGVYSQQSPSGYSTPPSATFSTDASSPRFATDMHLPSASLSRSSFYNGTRPPARRLSVPSAVVPFQAGPGQSYPPVYFTPMPPSAAPSFSAQSSTFPSPTASVFSHGRRESEAELEWRRRTWHPGTYASYATRPATSGLTYYQTPDDTRPALASQPAASQITRLPGIESFDRCPSPAPPARHFSSPTHSDNFGQPAVYPGPTEGPHPGLDERRSAPNWAAGLHQNLTKLEISHATPPKDGAGWSEQGRIEQGRMNPPGRPDRQAQAVPYRSAQAVAPPGTAITASTRVETEHSGEVRKGRRQAWYGGAPPQGSQPIMIAQRSSPVDSISSEGVPTPSTSQGKEVHPAIMHANGVMEMAPPGMIYNNQQHKAMQAQAKPAPSRADSGFQSYPYAHGAAGAPQGYVMQTGHHSHVDPEYAPPPPRPGNDMGRLEALVAVATSENRAAEHRS